jgi:hypothetical protein
MFNQLQIRGLWEKLVDMAKDKGEEADLYVVVANHGTSVTRGALAIAPLDGMQ